MLATLAGLLVLGLPLALIVLFGWAVLSPGEPTLTVTDESLVVELHRGDVVVSMRRRITIPRAQIEGVAVAAVAALPRASIRIYGTGMPGLRAGLFGGGGSWRRMRDREFWVVRRAKEVLVIEMKQGAPLCRYVFEMLDPRHEMLQLRPELGAYSGVYTKEQ